MTKIAFVFPGQGAQYVGMGKEIADKFEEAREVFETADKVLGYKISKICFEGPEEELKQTINTQPAILTTSYAINKILAKNNIKPEFVAGHSLGEYSALVAAGVLSFEDAVSLVHKRGQYMEEAVPGGKGTMAAILGLEFEDVEKLCEKASAYGLVQPANYNCPGQVVIAGETEAVERAIELASEMGAKRAVKLKVSGPFHSTLMKPAAEKLAEELEKKVFKDPEIPVCVNFSGEIISNGMQLKEGLKKQVNNPVMWDKSIRTLLNNDVTTFIEVGPGKVLSGLIKKINRKTTLLNVEDIKSLEKTLEKVEVLG